MKKNLLVGTYLVYIAVFNEKKFFGIKQKVIKTSQVKYCLWKKVNCLFE